jgi:epsilon-lactone hydrolase
MTNHLFYRLVFCAICCVPLIRGMSSQSVTETSTYTSEQRVHMPSSQYVQFYQSLMSSAPTMERPINQIRQGFEKMMAAFPAAPDITMEAITIGKIPATWVHAPQATKQRIILFFHGGGYSVGSTSSHQDFLGRLSRETGCYILSIDYRLAPENPFPAALEDAQEAYHFLLKEGYTSRQIVLVGTSAGGGLAFSLLFALKEKGEIMPLAILGLCPWLDLSLSENSIKRNSGKDIIEASRLQAAVDWYLHDASQKDMVKNPKISPLFGDPTGFPNALIMTGSYELLFDECVHFSDKLKACKVPVVLDISDDMFHTWFLYSAKFPEGQNAIERMAEYISNL